MLFGKSSFPIENRLFVISGGSQGVGAAFAKQIFSRGGNVVIVARNKIKLEQVVKESEQFRINETQTFEYISADLSIPEESARVFDSLDAIPDVIVCCAGAAHPGLLSDLDTKTLAKGVEANYLTALYFSHAGFKKMISVEPIPQVSRNIIFFSSVVAFYPFIGYGQYAPLKSAVRSLSDVLRQEGIPYNVNVACVFPGNTMSDGFLEEERTKPSITRQIEGPSSVISAEECSDIIIKKLERGQGTITTDLIGWLLSCMVIGASPRVYGFFQVFVALLLNIFGPIISWFISREIKNFYNKKNDTKRIDPKDIKTK